MNIFIKSIFFLMASLIFVSCTDEESLGDKVIISIIKENNTKKFDSIEKGFLDQIHLDKLDVHINFYTSNGDDLSIIEIANKVRDDNSTIAIVMGENAALVSMNVIVPQSIIFAGCLDPHSLESIKRSKIQNNNITGVYGVLDITKYLDIISTKKVSSFAYLYSKHSRISPHVSDELMNYCSNSNINYYPLIIKEDDDINDVERMITSKNIDYLYLAREKYINDNIYNIDFICDKYAIPMINTDLESALNVGILFSLDFNYYYLGRQLALLLSKVIDNNGSTDGIDFVKVEDAYRLLLNTDAAKLCNINFTEEILEKRYIMISNGNILRK